MLPPKHHLSGTGTGKPPAEKSRFVQTCNRLSLFLKEKGNIRDLNVKFDATGVSATPPTTVDLLSNIAEKASQAAKNSLPQYVILDSSCELEDSTSPAVTKPKTAQMTIFYQGHVMVLDDVPADRARDLVLMAKNGKIENRVESSKSPVDVSGSKQVMIKADLQAKESDLPIARRASLHKFLAKRKDRATVRAPYQLHNQSPGGSSSGNEHSFDLNM